jgi:hypothetical protein
MGAAKGKRMNAINMSGVIEQAIAAFAQNRTGPRPSVRAKIPPHLPAIPWHDPGLGKFIKRFLYDALMTSSPEVPVRVSVNERSRLSDLEAFVRLLPVCWIQLRVEGRRPGVTGGLVEELFRDFDYRCEEWVGVEGSDSQLAIFCPNNETGPKVVFCADLSKPIWKCDLLIPVMEQVFIQDPPGRRKS